jgi:CheY-like chemotaxis protein
MMTVRRAVDGAQVVMVDDDQQLAELLKMGVDLVLMNRELNYGFDESFGVDVIRRLRAAHPHVRMMLVTNYPDVQADAIAAGALPGFGKRELGTPRVVDVLRAALE